MSDSGWLKEMENWPTPEENVQLFPYLYAIETAMRELIIELLQTPSDPKWYVHRLPSDILTKYKDAIGYERSIPWTECVPHHPMYYVDFPDLKKIIERSDNWPVFEGVFTRKGKDVFRITMFKLEPIRNKIAHNRRATRNDVETVRSAYMELSAAIGDGRFRTLASRNTVCTDIGARLTALREECDHSFSVCVAYNVPINLDVWRVVCLQWWFDESYLGSSVRAIVDYFNTIEKYVRLPRARGMGHKIEAWIEANQIRTKHAEAVRCFSDLLDSEGVNRWT